MPRLRYLLTLSLGAALLHLPTVQAEELPEAIKKIEAKGAKIVGQFDAPDGLRGYAAQYQNRGMALYLTPDGKHVLVGSLFDEQGKDLSLEPLEKLVYAPMAKAIWAKLDKTSWIADGKGVIRAGIGGNDDGKLRFMYRSNAGEQFKTVSNEKDATYTGAVAAAQVQVHILGTATGRRDIFGDRP